MRTFPAKPSPPGPEATLHEIVSALQAKPEADAPTCALCRLTERSVERSLRALFAEFVNDPQTRQRFRKSRGFCAAHTPLLASLGDALGVAILYHDLIEQTRERWQKSERASRRSPWGKKAQTATEPCPACQAAHEAGQRYAGALAAGLENADVWAALTANGEICVAHAEQVLTLAPPASAERLRQLLLTRLEALQSELAEIIRKNDYRYRGEAWGLEKDAWLRALKMLTRPT